MLSPSGFSYILVPVDRGGVRVGTRRQLDALVRGGALFALLRSPSVAWCELEQLSPLKVLLWCGAWGTSLHRMYLGILCPDVQM